MSPTKVTATELARSLSDILNRIHYGGERFVIERNGKVIATLGPPVQATQPTVQDFVETLRRLPRLGPEFADDVEEAIARQSKTEPPAWES
jgi:antitoxin (DNA-binding transcriptional repressor) of toxin-antitoxin stability system